MVCQKMEAEEHRGEVGGKEDVYYVRDRVVVVRDKRERRGNIMLPGVVHFTEWRLR